MKHRDLLIVKQEFKSYIDFLTNEYENQIYANADVIIHQTGNKLKQFKECFDKIDTPTDTEEIYFFKRIKPSLLAIIQLCNYIKILEVNKPAKKFKRLKSYYLKELSGVKSKLLELDYFYSYYKSRASHHDRKFFLRNINMDFLSNISGTVVEIDTKSNTPYVPLFAQIESLHFYKDYLKKRIKSFNKEKFTENHTQPKLKWTSSKSGLIELIYALHASGSFNNGQADLKLIAQTFEEIFDIDLGQYNRIFIDIKCRKINKTKFIDHIKDNLINKIKSTENELFYD